MGEYADYDIDQGISEWLLHDAGECDDPFCPYCYACRRLLGYRKPRKKRRKPLPVEKNPPQLKELIPYETEIRRS